MNNRTAYIFTIYLIALFFVFLYEYTDLNFFKHVYSIFGLWGFIIVFADFKRAMKSEEKNTEDKKEDKEDKN